MEKEEEDKEEETIFLINHIIKCNVKCIFPLNSAKHFKNITSISKTSQHYAITISFFLFFGLAARLVGP